MNKGDPEENMRAENRHYRRYRPKMYMPQMSIFWWTRRKPYVLFIVRELTSIFVAAYAVMMLVQLNALGRGGAEWETLLAWLATPWSIAIHLIILIAVLYHSITWFWIAPTAVVLQFRGKRVPDAVIIAGNLIAWLLLSLAVGWWFVSL